MVQEKFKNWKSVDIAILLKELNLNDRMNEDVYHGVRELCRRSINRIVFPLDTKQREDLIHDVATNIFLFLNRPSNYKFVVSNWLKFVYNKTFKTALAIYPKGHERKEIFEIEDTVTQNEFIDIYFSGTKNYCKKMMDCELEVSLDCVWEGIYKLTKSLCRYREDSLIGNAIICSTLASITMGKQIILSGIELQRDIDYIGVLKNLVLNNIPREVKQSLLQYNPLLDEYYESIGRFNKYGLDDI